MIVRLVLWSLGDVDVTIGELRDYLRDESVEAFSDVEGLLFKAWVSDESSERWGAVYVWDSVEASEQTLPSHARELIGKDPEVIDLFDLEATVSSAPQLTHLGLAFE